MIAVIVFDVVFLFKQVFSSKMIFVICGAVIAMRLLIVIILQIGYCATRMFITEDDKFEP